MMGAGFAPQQQQQMMMGYGGMQPGMMMGGGSGMMGSYGQMPMGNGMGSMQQGIANMCVVDAWRGGVRPA